MSSNVSKSRAERISARNRNPRNNRRSVILFLLFLLLSFSLIFCVATLGIRRDSFKDLNLTPIPEIAANYGVDQIAELQRPAKDSDIITDRQQDDLITNLPTPTAIPIAAQPTLVTEATPTPTPTATPETPALVVLINGPYLGDEGSDIPVEAESENLVGLLPGTIDYEWDFDNDGQYDDGEGAATDAQFDDEGEYTIGVQASDLLGRVATDTTTILVRNVAPTIVFNQELLAVNEAEEFFLEAEVDDPGDDTLFFQWIFGDNEIIENTLTPIISFPDDGDYAVTLRVDDNDGGVTEEAILVEVSNLPPVAEAGANQIVTEGDTLIFVGTATDPAEEFDELTYAWDLDYDGSNFEVNALGPTASATYNNGPDDILVALRVQDEDGGSTIDTLNVRVNNGIPTLTNVTSSGSRIEGSPVTLEIIATDVGSDTLTFSFDWENDGTYEVTSLSAIATNTWPDNGEYTVGVQVEDGNDVIRNTAVISIANAPPKPVINGPAVVFKEGESVEFNATGTTDPGTLDVPSLNYSWAFGDGTVLTGETVSHVFADNDVFSTTLTVTDKDGGIATTGTFVEIANADPVAEAGTNFSVDENVSIISLAGVATDPGTDDTLIFEWDYDYNNNPANFQVDGAGPDIDIPTNLGALTRLLDGPEVRTFGLRVRDDDYDEFATDDKGESIDTLQVTVNNVAPAVIDVGLDSRFLDSPGVYRVIETQLITFTGEAIDVDPDINAGLTYDWDIVGNGITPDATETISGTTASASIIVPVSAGTYNLELLVFDKDGGVGTGNAILIVDNALPTAVADTNAPGDEGTPISFFSTRSSDPFGDPLTYTWDFGDGITTTTTIMTVTHTYSDSGIFPVTLTVDDGKGGSDTDTISTQVNNVDPTILLLNANPTTISETTAAFPAVTFIWAGSDVLGDEPFLTYDWDFGDGSPPAINVPPPNIAHAYNDDGNFLAQLTVSDDDGGSTTQSIPITVVNLPPTAAANIITAGPYDEGDVINFDAGGSSDPGADTLTYTWDFGDGIITSTTNTIIPHTYIDEGVYPIILTVSDGDGGVDVDTTLSVTVQNVDPTAVATITTAAPYTEGQSLRFSGNGSSDPGLADTLTYTWNFDDGVITSTTNLTITHIFPDDNLYTVVLTVTDGDGGQDVTSLPMTIQNAAPTVNANGPYTTTVSTVVTVTASGVDVPADILTYRWDLDNDGIFEAVGQSALFTSSVAGTFVITVEVDDGDGGITIDATTVTVSTFAPLLFGLGLSYAIQGIVTQLRRRRRNNAKPS